MARALSAFLLVFSVLSLLVGLTELAEILAGTGVAIFAMDAAWARLLNQNRPRIGREPLL